MSPCFFRPSGAYLEAAAPSGGFVTTPIKIVYSLSRITY